MHRPGKKVVLSVTNDLVNDRRMIRTCTSLHESGYQVTFIGRETGVSPSLSRMPFRQKRIRCFFRSGALFYAEFNLRLLGHLVFRRTDILVASDLDTLLPNMIAAWLKGARLVYDAHEYFTEVPELNGRKRVKRIWESIGKICVPRADLCTTVSGSLAEILSEKYGKPFHVIMNVPEYIADTGRRQANPSPVPVLVYQGAINQGRGLDESINAMKKIPALLKIAGDGPLMKELTEMIRVNALGEKVIFTGRLSPSQLSDFTSEATIGLNLLSDDSLSYRYSLGNKFFDYIHSGIPQICIDMPEYRALNDKYDIALLCRNRAEDIGQAANLLINDRSLYARLKSNCRRAALDLNWQNEQIKLITLFSCL